MYRQISNLRNLDSDLQFAFSFLILPKDEHLCVECDCRKESMVKISPSSTGSSPYDSEDGGNFAGRDSYHCPAAEVYRVWSQAKWHSINREAQSPFSWTSCASSCPGNQCVLQIQDMFTRRSLMLHYMQLLLCRDLRMSSYPFDVDSFLPSFLVSRSPSDATRPSPLCNLPICYNLSDPIPGKSFLPSSGANTTPCQTRPGCLHSQDIRDVFHTSKGSHLRQPPRGVSLAVHIMHHQFAYVLPSPRSC